mgnify:FL=1
MKRALLVLIAFLALAAPALASDVAGTQVAATTDVTTAITNTDAMDVRNFAAIDWVIDITSVGSATDLACLVTIECDVLATSGSSNWAKLQSESISAGTATQSDYTYSKSSITAVTRLLVSAPARGRHMRLNIDWTSTTVSGNFEVKAYRRTDGDGGSLKP